MMKALVLPVLGLWALLGAVVKLGANLIKVLWELLKTVAKLATGLIKVLWELLKTALDTLLKVLPIVVPALALAGRGIGRGVRGIGKGGRHVVQRIRRTDTPPNLPQ
ncbi:MAG: hypothetical protein OXG17_07100 [Chloroflexi bacterium]|nr:hypothetical protein [Chloroflexota bacterium]